MTRASATTSGARRPLALQGVLVALIALALLGGWNAVTHREQFFAEFPRFTPVLWALYLGWVPVGVASKAGMLLWRRWALWLTFLGGVFVAALELYVGMGAKTLRVFVSLTLLALLARPHWERFR